MSAPVVVKQFPLEKEYAKKTGVTPEDVAKLRAWLATKPHLPGDLITVPITSTMSAPVVVKQFPLEKEYAKKTGVTPEAIAKFRAWVATQPHLPGDMLSDLDLILVYYCSQLNLEGAKQLLDLNLTLKTHFTKVFKDYVFPPRTIANIPVTPLPLKMRAHNGSAVLYAIIADPDPSKFVLHECMRVILMALELWQEEEGTWPGLELIIDLRNFSLDHLAKLDLPTMQQFFNYVQDPLLAKVKGYHFMNAPAFMDKIMMMITPFMKNEFKDLIFIYQVGSTTLEEHVPMKALPKEAGGEFISMMKAREDMKERFILNKDFFERELKKRVDESRRPGGPKSISDILTGTEGPLRNLEID